MILIKTAIEIYHLTARFRTQGKKLGFVPTMGALHDGHMGLISNSLQQNGATICSIFVNPTQFNDPSDFEKYPISIEKDILLLERSGCDILFLPNVLEVYPTGVGSSAQYDLGQLETVLEGQFRPGHFQGVCQVVDRLLQIIQPNRIYLGQKDFQQCLVVQKMMEGHHPSIEMVTVATKRELNGLAMSSRNLRLSEASRQKAGAIFEALMYIKNNWGKKSVKALIDDAGKQIEQAGFDKIDYIAIVRKADLTAITQWEADTSTLVLVAAFIDGVRLIDNLSLS